MAISLIRTVIVYAAVICVIRLMGKRQIGEMQPSELVVTILISEIASMPLQSNDVSVINSLASLFLIVSFEILTSAINLKSHKIRSLMQGHAVTVINNGKIDKAALKELRMTVSDLLSALRQKDVFEISQVEFAAIETNGKISLVLKPEHRNATAADVGAKPADTGIPHAIICGGEIIGETVAESGLTEKELNAILSKQGCDAKNIIVLTVRHDGKVYCQKDGEKK